MKKTQGVTKYEIEWQMLRVSLKGTLNENEQQLINKISKAYFYFKEGFSYERWERVFNWAEGLLRGYYSKNESFKNIVKEFLDFLKEQKPAEILTEVMENDAKVNLYTQSQLQDLWVDLFKTNKKWLLKGYFHKECNDFMDFIFLNLKQENLILKQEELISLRQNSNFIHNKHKFFF